MDNVIRVDISNDNEVEFEQLRAARAGLNRTDHDTVVLQINDQRFAMPFADFLSLIETWAENAREFSVMQMEAYAQEGSI